MNSTLISMTVSMLLMSFLCTAVSAHASEPLVLEGEVSGVWELFVDSSPAPVCGVGPWDAVLGEGEDFSFSGSLDEEPCISWWQVHCSGDSLGYRGLWKTDDPTNYRWNFSFARCEISLQLSFPEAVRLYATSESEGVLELDSHRVAITPAEGDEVVLLGPEPGASVEYDLAPGMYTIDFLVDVREHHTHYDYLASLQVWWEDQSGVPQHSTSWAGIKALYR